MKNKKECESALKYLEKEVLYRLNAEKDNLYFFEFIRNIMLNRHIIQIKSEIHRLKWVLEYK